MEINELESSGGVSKKLTGAMMIGTNLLTYAMAAPESKLAGIALVGAIVISIVYCVSQWSIDFFGKR